MFHVQFHFLLPVVTMKISRRRPSQASPAIEEGTNGGTNGGAPPNSRIRRKSRLRRRSIVAPRSSSNTASSLLPLTFWVGLAIVTLWLLTAVYVLNQLQQKSSSTSSLLIPIHRRPFLQTLSGGMMSQLRGGGAGNNKNRWAARNGPKNLSETEVTDMRVLSNTLAFDNPDGGAWKQGWDVQPVTVDKNHPLTVYVVPHSHCDPGWIKTFDEYFQQQTKSILTTVVDALIKDSRRTFIWAEISYFEWWWKEQTIARQKQVQTLFENGQLEFVTGGWVMPDEADSELYAMEIQLQEGHDWIQTHLGEAYIPKYGWSIDPFGYSPTMAWLLKKYGFQAMLIQRVHYAVKKELAKEQRLEFYWRQTWDNTGEHDIFTHLMPFFSYDVPHTCGPDPSVCCQFDFKRATCPWNKSPQTITDANVQERSMLLLDQYQKKAALYRSNVLLVPLGDDFRYDGEKEAEAQFANYQKIFDYLNNNVPGVTVQFGTLSQYFQAVQDTFATPILKGSFFTYSDVDEDYWSGYFTSRVFDKALDRQLERILYAAETVGGSKLELQEPRRALSLFQHHDGVTGTAKKHVVEDYAKRIHKAIRFTQEWMVRRLQERFPSVLPVAFKAEDVLPCWVSNAPRGLIQNLCGDEGNVYVYNPLETEQSCGTVVVPPQRLAQAQLPCEVPGGLPSSKSSTWIVFDPITGLMTEPIREEWKVWKVTKGGAYLFFPGQLRSYDLTDEPDFRVEQDGYVVTTDHWKRTVVEKQVPTEFGTTATVIDFIYETHLTNDNEEWFVRFSGKVANGGTFHTDLNGFNFDTHQFRADLPIQSQVFPMPTLACIEDDRLRMTVLSEHAQGTASLQDGSIDVWLDRRLSQDDSRGMGQGVQDNMPTRTRLRIVLEQEGYDPAADDFQVTPLGRRMWDELQHPLEMFGKHTIELEASDAQILDDDPPADALALFKLAEERRAERALKREARANRRAGKPAPIVHQPQVHSRHGPERSITVHRHTVDNTNVPFVFMVYKRIDYFKKVIESLRKSDFPKSRVPIIVSHDGRVPEMVEYVETLKGEFNVIQIFHPYSCYEHPDTFPGDDKKLNEDYKGDTYGNPRSPWATCCKHHFTWMLKTVFEMDLGSVEAEHFFFTEEDYVVAPTIYSTIISGLNAMETFENELVHGFFGLVLDPTQADNRAEPTYLDDETWFAEAFISGPMTMSRVNYEIFKQHAIDFCTFDEYNWDWSFTHLQGMSILPHTVLVPSRRQVRHIGIAEGMHAHKKASISESLDERFAGKKVHGDIHVKQVQHDTGYGGWGHPKDHEHCMNLLDGNEAVESRL